MIKIAILGSCHQINKENQIKTLFSFLKNRNYYVIVEKEFSEYLQSQFNIDIISEVIVDNNFSADIALSIGGDGTFLRTARFVENKNIPILGINAGRLGFLADIPLNDINKAIEAITNRDFYIEERTLIQMEITNYDSEYIKYGLNEVAILKNYNSSMITIKVDIDNNYLNSYEADGLIISTPTGSTGYSLSVGGPIIEPSCHNMVISPVAPHSLTTRPLVISDNYTLKINTQSRVDSYQVSIDGNSYTLNKNNTIIVKKAPFKLSVIKIKGHTFYDTLRDKLMWGIDKRI